MAGVLAGRLRMHVRMRRCLQGQLTLDVSQVFAFVSRVVRSTEVYMFEGLYDAQNVAIICNATRLVSFYNYKNNFYMFPSVFANTGVLCNQYYQK